jgi:hypothetical protein
MEGSGHGITWRTVLGYGLDGPGSIPSMARFFSSGANPSSYPMGTGGSFPEGITAGA